MPCANTVGTLGQRRFKEPQQLSAPKGYTKGSWPRGLKDTRGILRKCTWFCKLTMWQILARIALRRACATSGSCKKTGNNPPKVYDLCHTSGTLCKSKNQLPIQNSTRITSGSCMVVGFFNWRNMLQNLIPWATAYCFPCICSNCSA